jgi:hypothetical protein
VVLRNRLGPSAPFVKDKRPTGYIDEIRNLVPSCGSCNQSKGGQDWKAWIQGTAVNSPASRGIKDVPQRIARLEAFEAWGNVQPIDLAALIGKDVVGCVLETQGRNRGPDVHRPR